jgi:hypothetical protein
MSLTNEERDLIADHVAEFAMKMILQAVSPDEEVLRSELDSFHEFFCKALEAAKRDARREALVTTLN